MKGSERTNGQIGHGHVVAAMSERVRGVSGSYVLDRADETDNVEVSVRLDLFRCDPS